MSITIKRGAVFNAAALIVTIGCAVGALLVTSKVMLVANESVDEPCRNINQYRIVTDRLEGDQEKAVFNFDVRKPSTKESAEKVVHAVKTMIQSIIEANGDEELMQDAIEACAI